MGMFFEHPDARCLQKLKKANLTGGEMSEPEFDLEMLTRDELLEHCRDMGDELEGLQEQYHLLVASNRRLEAENAELEMKYDAAIETANALDLDRERLEKLERLVKYALHQRIEIIKVKSTIQISWGTEHLGRYYSQGDTFPEAIDNLP